MRCEPANTLLTLLGGITKVAKRTNVRPITAMRWRYPAERGGTDGIIPPKYHDLLMQMGADLGVEIPRTAFVDPEIAAGLLSTIGDKAA